MKVTSIVGARPQFIKLAPFMRVCSEGNGGTGISHSVVHSGQHYDYEMNRVFFEQLGIPAPEHNLAVGSGSHGWQMGEMMIKMERIFLEDPPDMVLVYGDTNTTLAGALVAAKLHIPLAHVESGLRSFNRRMPEEINRILTDHSSDILFVPTLQAVGNLKNEGIGNTFFEGQLIDIELTETDLSGPSFPIVVNVGDIMFDSVLHALEIAEGTSTILDSLELRTEPYLLATVHRAENTDDLSRLTSILKSLSRLSEDVPVVFPVHPRTRKILDSSPELTGMIQSLRIIEPVGYFDMLILMKNALKILTDSGGMQKEAYYLKVPCVTIRDETEWVETLEKGYNVLVGTDEEDIMQKAQEEFVPGEGSYEEAYYGDGRCAQRMSKVISFSQGMQK